MGMEQDDLPQMFLELTELLNAGWRIHIEPSLQEEQLMKVPATITFRRWATSSSAGDESLHVSSIEVNRYQLRWELPRVIHLFHARVVRGSEPDPNGTA